MASTPDRIKKLQTLTASLYGGDYDALRVDLEQLQKAQHVAVDQKKIKAFVDKPTVLKLENVGKTYKTGGGIVTALSDISFDLHQGQIIALVGPSGSGKSTLLNIIGGLDKQTSGEVVVDGVSLKKLHDRQLSNYRAQKIGFVFQFFYLQPFLNLQTNVEIPAMFTRGSRKERHSRSARIVREVGLEDRLGHYPSELSGGQMQRVAIARAMINSPKMILADEPTGNLDSVNAQNIMDLFVQMRESFNTAVLVVTHDMAVARRADQIIYMNDGRVEA